MPALQVGAAMGRCSEGRANGGSDLLRARFGDVRLRTASVCKAE